MHKLLKKVIIIFITLYIIIIGSIFSFYIDVINGYNKTLSSTQNKIIGVEYLRLLHKLSAGITVYHEHDSSSNNTKRIESIKISRKNIYSYLEEFPRFNNATLDKYLKALDNISLEYSDYYNFFDYINHENYMVGDSAEILFSEDKERYFLGTLMTHYIPEFFISLGIYHNILEDILSNKVIDETKSNMYVEHSKLIYLSSQELQGIISLLHEYDDSKGLYKIINKITDNLEQLKKDNNNLKTLHQLINLAEELNSENTQLLNKLLKKDEVYLKDKILFYEILLIFMIFLVTSVFIYFLNIFISNIKKDKELNALNNSLTKKVKEEVHKNREKDRHMIEQSRMAQMGEMISMIAHQWRQPLSAISSTSASMILKTKLNKIDNDTIIELSTDISNYAQHLSSTIDDFRNFFKSDKEKKKVTYSELIESVIGIVESTIKSRNIKLTITLECDYIFYTYPNEIKQVILNLIKNAEDILLEKEIENPKIDILTKNGVLSVSDNGGGIPEDILDKIFDPYFSTKLEKNGTGLGLYMSKTIIEEHCGGKLTVSNDKDGAVFKIKLESDEVA